MRHADRIVIQAVLLVAMCLPIAACKTHEVNTWERWCEQVTQVDLKNKYRGWAVVFGVSYNAEAIREDFANRFHKKAITSVRNRYFGGVSIDDPVLEEMVQIRLIGVWHESTELHWAHAYLSLEAEPSLAFSIVVDEIEQRLEQYRSVGASRPEDAVARASTCTWATIDGVYETLVLHGPGERVSEIDLRYSLPAR